MQLPEPSPAYSAENEAHTRALIMQEDGRNLKKGSNGIASAIFINVQDAPYKAKGDGSSDDTSRIQAAIDDCYDVGGGTVFSPRSTYAVTSLRRNWDASRSVHFIGAGKRATKFVKHGSGTDPIIDWSADDSILETSSDLRDFSIEGASKLFDGIRLTKCARFSIDNVDVRACDKAINNAGALVWTGRNLTLQGNNYGVLARKSGSIYANAITIENSQIVGNATYGVDAGEGSGFMVRDCDVESNGTAANTSTGGIIFRDTMDDENGVCDAGIDNVWFESNNGWSLSFEATTNGVYAINRAKILAPESGHACRILGGKHVSIMNSFAASPGDTLSVAAANFVMIASLFNTISDTSASSIYLGSADGNGAITKSLNNFDSGGSFTPVVSGSSAAGSGTYTGTPVGKWQRNGNRIDFSLAVVWSAHTGTGNLLVDLNDIPFAAANSIVNYPCQVRAENLTYSNDLTAVVNVNSKIVAFYSQSSGGSLSAVAIDTAAALEISGWYRIANS